MSNKSSYIVRSELYQSLKSKLYVFAFFMSVNLIIYFCIYKATSSVIPSSFIGTRIDNLAKTNMLDNDTDHHLMYMDNINASNSQTKITMLNESQIRVYIMGSGHCGTTFMQQFIGDVVLNKSESFYLFEAAHRNIVSLLQCHGYHKKDEVLLITDFFQCKFIDKCNYSSFSHSITISRINFGKSQQKLTAEALRNKCISSKYLIYKDLFGYLYGTSNDNMRKLYTQYTDITVINLVRNPLYQIISISRYRSVIVENYINNICIHQPLFHELLRNVTNKYVIMKMEQFYKNITDSLTETVLYFYNLIVGGNKINMTDTLLKYEYMKQRQHQWPEGRLNPVHTTTYKQMETQLQQIANHSKCQEFANKYNYSLAYEQLL